ncbi:MAG: hypothetical protein ACREKE_05830, partial [bacterium]
MMAWLSANSVPFSAWNMGSSGPNVVNTAAWTYAGNADPGASSYPTTSYFGAYVEAALTNTAADNCGPSATVTPIVTHTSSYTASATPSATPSITPTALGTPSDSPTVSLTPSISPTPSASATLTITPSFSVTSSFSPTSSISPTLTPGPSAGLPPQLYPNPFHPDAGQELHFTQIEAGTTIHIYSLIGRRVRTLNSADSWDGRNDNGRMAVTGIYLIYIMQPSGRHDLLRAAILP